MKTQTVTSSSLLPESSWVRKNHQRMVVASASAVEDERDYTYTGCCVFSAARDIDKMVSSAKKVTYDEMKTYCKAFEQFEDILGYGPGTLLLEKDWHVEFYKSSYRDKPCYFLVHSAIEWIWWTP